MGSALLSLGSALGAQLEVGSVSLAVVAGPGVTDAGREALHRWRELLPQGATLSRPSVLVQLADTLGWALTRAQGRTVPLALAVKHRRQVHAACLDFAGALLLQHLDGRVSQCALRPGPSARARPLSVPCATTDTLLLTSFAWGSPSGEGVWDAARSGGDAAVVTLPPATSVDLHALARADVDEPRHALLVEHVVCGLLPSHLAPSSDGVASVERHVAADGTVALRGALWDVRTQRQHPFALTLVPCLTLRFGDAARPDGYEAGTLHAFWSGAERWAFVSAPLRS